MAYDLVLCDGLMLSCYHGWWLRVWLCHQRFSGDGVVVDDDNNLVKMKVMVS